MARLLRPIAAGAFLLVSLSASRLAQTHGSPLPAMNPQKLALSSAERAARKAKARARLEFREKCKKS